MARQIVDGFIFRDDLLNITPSPSFFAAKKKNPEPELEEQPSPTTEPEPTKELEPVTDGADNEITEAPDSSEPTGNNVENEVQPEIEPEEELAPEDDEANATVTAASEPLKEENEKPKKEKRKFKLPSLHNLHTGKKRKIIIGVSCFVGVIIIGLVGVWAFYRHKVVPNTYLMGQNIGGYNQTKLEGLISSREAGFKLTVNNGQQKLTPKNQDIGLTFNDSQTINEALSTHRSGNFWNHLTWWKRTNINLSTNLDATKFSNYLTSNVKTAIKDPVNATIVYDAGSQNFTIQPDQPGSGIIVEKAATQVLDSAVNGQSLDLNVSTEPVTANITSDGLSATLASAQNYLKSSVSLNANGTSIIPSLEQKASWLNFTANKNHSYDISVNQSAIQSYVQSVTGGLNKQMQPQLTITMQDGTSGGVIQNGQNGTNVTNQNQLIAALTQAFSNRQNYTGQINIATTPFTTQDMTAYPQWIYVSLSQQRLTAYQYNQPVNSFLIASGTMMHPTDLGVFHVWYKVPVQTMTGGSKASGDYYSLPNVHWDTYFDGQEAIHEAYWLQPDQFGHPQSHGCLNATYDDAQWIYNWAPIGTTVVVQN